MPDPYLDDPDESEGNSTIQQMRDELARSAKERKELQKALDKASQTIQENETRFKLQAATAFGLTDRQAQTFLKDNPEAEINAETVTSWKQELGLATPQVQAEPEESAAEVPAAFRPVAGNDPPVSRMKWPEFKQLMTTDPDRAYALASQGLVEGVDPD